MSHISVMENGIRIGNTDITGAYIRMVNVLDNAGERTLAIKLLLDKGARACEAVAVLTAIRVARRDKEYSMDGDISVFL